MLDGRYYVGVALLAVAGQFALPDGLEREGAHLVIHAGAAVAVCTGVIRHRPPRPYPWLLLGVAIVPVGQIVRLLDLPAPLPAVGMVPAAAATAAAIWIVIARRPGRGNLVDGAMVVGTSLLMATGVAIAGLLTPDRLATLGVAALMLAAVVVAARLVLATAPAPPSLLGLLGAALLALGGNLLEMHYGPLRPELSRWADGAFLLSSVLVGWAAMHPSMLGVTQPRRPRQPAARPVRLLIFGWALLVGPLLVALGPHRPAERIALAAGIGVLVLMVLWRIWLVMAQREEAQSALASSERRYRSLMRHAFDAIAILAEDGSILYASPALGRLAGGPEDSLTGTDVTMLVHPEDAVALRGCLTSSRLCADDVVRAQLRLGRAPAPARWADAFLVNRLHDPSIRGIVMNLRDVTEHKRTEMELSRLALHDSLTGLPNRHALLGELEDALRYEVRRLEGLAVLFADLDGFKAVNDRHGHAVGDQLLVKVARRLHNALRPGDVLARYGGDEFVILALGVDNEAQAIALAARLRQTLVPPIASHDTLFPLDITVGIALTHQRDTRAQDLLDAADMAMYRAKHKGEHVACHRGSTAATMGRDLTPIPR